MIWRPSLNCLSTPRGAGKVAKPRLLESYPAKLGFPCGGVVECWHTDVHELRAGDWQAVWSQATRWPEPAAGVSP